MTVGRDSTTMADEEGVDEQSVALGMVFGVAFGTALGVAFDDIALWLAVGIAIGPAFGIGMSRRRSPEP